MQALWLSLLLGAPVSDFTLTDPGGRPRTLGEWHSARLVVVAFLGNGCPLAKLYARKLTALAKKFGPRGVVVLGVNFNWQHRYVLAEPRRLPAGTRVRCEAVYDNSKDNPANP